MAESYTGDAYCVKCKEKRDFTGEVKVSESVVAWHRASAPCAAPSSTASSARPDLGHCPTQPSHAAASPRRGCRVAVWAPSGSRP